MELKVRNINDLFRKLVSGIHEKVIAVRKEESMKGEVLRITEPVFMTVGRPEERVLFNKPRNVHPPFILLESLWMIAGRNDVTPLAYFNRRMKEYSDDGVMLSGAYGHRWRKYFASRDQLKVLAERLKIPNNRQAVLQMWDAHADLFSDSKDICCNTHAYFDVSTGGCKWCGGSGQGGEGNIGYCCPYCKGNSKQSQLNMTVCNRSNDILWGLCGSDIPNLTFLQEYMASWLDIGVGVYRHFSNNLHVYTKRWEPEKWLADTTEISYSRIQTVPLVLDKEVFDKECVEFIDGWDKQYDWKEPFLGDIAGPVLLAYRAHKNGDHGEAKIWKNRIEADDWRIAMERWLNQSALT